MTFQDFKKIALSEMDSGKTVAEIHEAIHKAFISLSEEEKAKVVVSDFVTNWIRTNNDELIRILGE